MFMRGMLGSLRISTQDRLPNRMVLVAQHFSHLRNIKHMAAILDYVAFQVARQRSHNLQQHLIMTGLVDN